MIVLFTDFGIAGPYTGQVKAVLHRIAPAMPVVDLFADAPMRNPKAAAYLLPAYAREMPSETVFLCVIDPGVGGARLPLVVEADQRWYVGPDNGLFELIMRRARQARMWRIAWRPETLSASFHGRDLFAPVAARLALGKLEPGALAPHDDGRHLDWPDDLAEIVYIDHYGNAMTGLRAAQMPKDARIKRAGRELHRARTFSDVRPGEAFWYENSNGLAEIAVNLGRADEVLGLTIGSPIAVTP